MKNYKGTDLVFLFTLIMTGLCGCGSAKQTVGPATENTVEHTQGPQIEKEELDSLIKRLNTQTTRESQVDLLSRELVALSLRKEIPFEALEAEVTPRIAYDCPLNLDLVCVFKLSNHEV